MNSINNTKSSKVKPLSPRELSIFCEQAAMMIKSGMLLYYGMQMLAKDTEDIRIKGILEELSGRLATKESFEDALLSTGAFPDYMIHMVAIGSESGRLDSVMDSLSTYYNRQYNLREMIKSAIVYPSVLIGMMLTVLIFLITKVLPVFKNVFNSLGANLSASADLIVRVGNLLSHYSILLSIIIVLFFLSLLFFTKTKKGHDIWNKWLAQRKFSENFSISAFASSMALMLSSGLDTEQSMRLSLQMVVNTNVKSKIEQCIKLVSEHDESLIGALEKTNIFSNTTVGILSIGSKAGTLDSAMNFIADLYENEFQSSVMKKIALIEPISVSVLSILIGLILISVMFPLLGVMSSIG